MIGQQDLLASIDKYSIDNFPNTILLLGEKGSGKHLISNYIAKKFNFPLVDITQIIDNTVIDNIYMSSNPTFYLLDLSLCDIRKQNVMLKFLEEPTKSTFIILLAETKVNILDTILNRAFIFEMGKYSDEELLNFCDDLELIKVLRTPGKLIACKDNSCDIINLCDKIYTSIHKANFANMLTLAEKFNYSDSFDKIDLDTFLSIFMYRLFNIYAKEKENKALQMYLIVDDEKKKLSDTRLNKKVFTQHLFVRIWKEFRNNG